MLTITDWDGTPVGDTCTILGGGMTETDICETINGLPSADSQLGDKYVTINSEGECVLTDSIKIDICGIIQEIQEESDLAEGDVFFIQRGINCFKVPWGLLSTDCIALTMEAGDLRADIITDPSPPSPYKKVYCGENGLYADSTTVDCEQLRNLFPSGSFESNDHILSFDGNTDNCEWVSLSTLGVNCANVSALFVPATPTTNDSILVSAGGNCRKVRAESYSICSQTLTHWELGSCEQPQIVVKCGSECRYMTPCDIQTYVCAMMAPDIEKMIDDKFKDYPKFNPFKLGNSEANLPYPTVTNSGIKTVKNKIEALKDKNIPIGGLYYIAGGEEIKVKNVPYSAMVEDGIAYIRLSHFTENAGKEVSDALKGLRDSNEVTGIVLDLRGNPGGLLHEAVNVSNIFVERGQEIVSTKGKIKDLDLSLIHI